MDHICDWVGIDRYDNPDTGIAFNLYLCECGNLKKEMVWDNKGESICKAEYHFNK